MCVAARRDPYPADCRRLEQGRVIRPPEVAGPCLAGVHRLPVPVGQLFGREVGVVVVKHEAVVVRRLVSLWDGDVFRLHFAELPQLRHGAPVIQLGVDEDL